MRQFIQNRPFLSSLLINLVLFLVFLGLFYTRFGTTDDVEMQMVLAGKAIMPEASPFLRWTHLLISYPLYYLYNWFPDIPWYGYYLTTAHFMGMTAILYSILILKFSLFRICIYISCFWLGETAMLQELQFTSASITLGIGAVFLLFTAISNPNDNRHKVWYIVSGLLLCLVEMIRWNSFQLIVVLGTPLLLYAIFQQEQKRIKNIVYCTLILVSAWAIEQGHYLVQNQDPEWADFNYAMSLLAGHDILDYHKPQYHWTASTADDYFYKVGWEYEDLMLFKHWFIADSSVYGAKQIGALQTAFQDCPYPTEHIQDRLWQFFIQFPIEGYVFYGFLMLALSFMLFKGNRWLYLLFATMLTMVFTLLCSLFLFKHLPNRVSFPIAFYLIAFAALFITYDKEITRKTKLGVLILIGFMILSNMKMVTRNSSRTAFEKMYWTAALDSLDAQPEQLYIGGGDFYMQAIMTPYHTMSDSMFTNFNMLDFGHFSLCPNHYKQLERFDIKNIHTVAPLDSNIYFVHRYNASILGWYANFVYRRYNMHITYELVRREEDVNIAVYRIKEQIRDKPNSQGISLSNMHEFGMEPEGSKKIKDDPKKPKATYSETETFRLAQ